MFHYIARRLILVPVLLFGITLVVFSLIRLAPGDPITAQYGLKLSGEDPARIAQLRQKLGLNDPIYVQYLHYLNGLLHGDLGTSLTTQEPVTRAIASRFPATLELAASAMILVILFSIPLGVIAGLKRGTWVTTC